MSDPRQPGKEEGQNSASDWPQGTTGTPWQEVRATASACPSSVADSVPVPTTPQGLQIWVKGPTEPCCKKLPTRSWVLTFIIIYSQRIRYLCHFFWSKGHIYVEQWHSNLSDSKYKRLAIPGPQILRMLKTWEDSTVAPRGFQAVSPPRLMGPTACICPTETQLPLWIT